MPRRSLRGRALGRTLIFVFYVISVSGSIVFPLISPAPSSLGYSASERFSTPRVSSFSRRFSFIFQYAYVERFSPNTSKKLSSHFTNSTNIYKIPSYLFTSFQIREGKKRFKCCKCRECREENLSVNRGPY